MEAGAQVPLKPGGHDEAREVRDVAIRCVGIPLFGLLIPRLTGVLPWWAPRDGWLWAGQAWFLLLSAALWHGNRRLVLDLWNRLDWSARPWRRVGLILLRTTALTLPLTTLAMLAWQEWGPARTVDWGRIGLVGAAVMAAVLLVTHFYETCFLIKDRLEDRLRLAQQEKARLQAELATVKGQLAPHFLFNCLQSLAVLIEESPREAARFNRSMADVCRHLLVQQRHDLVPLADELAFFGAYADLARLRFPDSLAILCPRLPEANAYLIPPASLHLLLENAIKHNAFDAGRQLRISVAVHGGWLHFANPRYPAPGPASAGTGTGLRNLGERFRLVTGRDIVVAADAGGFRVALPLVPRRADGPEMNLARHAGPAHVARQ